ncbi:MAG: DUF805 domain-containing protein [Thermomicrobiales bacterium]
MGFTDAVRSGFNNYANFNGRALRSEYWWWAVFGWIAGVIARALDSALHLNFATDATTGQGSGVLSLIVSLALLIPGLAVAVRRLHDTDRSGWWLLLGIIPFLAWIVLIIGALVASSTNSDNIGGWLALGLVPLICWIVLLVWFASKGTPGPNRYGPSRDGQALAYPHM